METILIQLGTQQTFHISESSEIAAVRRSGSTLGRNLGFDEVRTGQLALVITEAATNIVKHAIRGEILLRPLQDGEKMGIEILAIDAGPGIGNIQLHMEDGHSSTGTYGVGLGAIGRLSQEFDMYSLRDQGTVLWMVIWADAIASHSLDWQVGAVCLPLPSEDVCGDDWMADSDGYTLNLLVADGLGHGPDAATASRAATALVLDHRDQPPGMLLQRAHAALHATRGAAVAIVQIDIERSQLRFAGVGNIAVSVFETEARRHLLSHNGIVGSNLRKVQEFSQAWQPGALLIAHSDGVGTRWDLESYPGLLQSHPSLVAAVLYRDFSRGRDDVTVVVIRDLKGA